MRGFRYVNVFNIHEKGRFGWPDGYGVVGGIYR
jgi:hypothetical protein